VEISQIVNTVVLAVASVTGVGGGILYKDEIKEWFATREYHDQDVQAREQLMLNNLDAMLKPIKASAEAGESNSLPPRIQNLLKVRCAAPAQFDPALQTMLERLRTRYQELNGRTYPMGECRDGVYYNSLGVRID
jgi:hypothetical protein